jgi:ABC-type phosphate transport system substrate-binding protein
MFRANRTSVVAAACGAALGLASAAAAQQAPTVIEISGATLLENFFRARASTVDYIDVDGNGVARGYPNSTNQQLANFGLPLGTGSGAEWPANVNWAVMYSAVGSTNGFQELINTGRTFVTAEDAAGSALAKNRRTAAYFNRYRYITAGTANDDNDPQFPPSVGLILNPANPHGAPVRSETTFIDWPANTVPNPDAFRALYTSVGVPSTAPSEGLTDIGGLAIDVAPLDVPTSYAVTQSGAPDLFANPLQPGYGNNARTAVDPDGSQALAGNRSNKLATLTGGANLYTPGVTPDADTIFDSSILFAPVAPVVNFGVGMSQIDMSNLNFLFSTGRLATGENLMVVTRDSGSGTRNAWDNSRGTDPSWQVGENVGVRNNSTADVVLGPSFLPSNKGGNNRVEPAVINHRLAVGYVGPERGVEQAWLTGGQMEILAVRADIAPYNQTTYNRPTIDNVLDNDGPSAWVIGGPSVLATFGDPRSAPPEKGGLGWMEPFNDTNQNGQYDDGEPFSDINGSGVRDAVEPRPAELNPPMRNLEAAA